MTRHAEFIFWTDSTWGAHRLIDDVANLRAALTTTSSALRALEFDKLYGTGCRVIAIAFANGPALAPGFVAASGAVQRSIDSDVVRDRITTQATTMEQKRKHGLLIPRLNWCLHIIRFIVASKHIITQGES